jgi:hypothetical protein
MANPDWNDDWDGADWSEHLSGEELPPTPDAERWRWFDLPAESYTTDWETIALARKQECSWKCQQCSVILALEHALLHVHHVDRDKTNNIRGNLAVLCAICHSEQPGHLSSLCAPKWRESIREYRRNQGLERS